MLQRSAPDRSAAKLAAAIACLAISLSAWAAFGQSESKPGATSETPSPSRQAAEQAAAVVDARQAEETIAAEQAQAPAAAEAVEQTPPVAPPPKPPAAAAPASPPAPVPPAGPDRPDVAAWRDRIDNLLLGLQTAQQTHRDADALYWELDRVLWPFHRAVRKSIENATPGYVDEHAALQDLYDQRNRLIPALSRSLRRRVTGGGEIGRATLRHEIAYLDTMLRSQVRTLERGVRQITSNLTESPLDAAWVTLQLGLALVVFRIWRRWSKRGLPEARERLLAIRPRQPVYLQLARLLWYLDRIGGSLAWLILVVVVSKIFNPRGFEELSSLIFSVLIWIIVARLAVQYIDAIAARGVGGLRKDRAALRLRTLRVFAAWAVLLGLGLDLVSHYAGEGAIHAWFTRGWEILSIPIAIMLVNWWRGELAERLEEISDRSEWAGKLAQPRKGLAGYAVAFAGVGLLVWVGLLKWLVRTLSGWELGRRILAVLVRREVARDVARERQVDEDPISDEVMAHLLEEGDVELDAVTQGPLAGLGSALSTHQGGGYVVLAERGGGKSVFLRRMSERLGDEMVVVDCPAGGYPALEAETAARLGLPLDGDPHAALAATLDARGTLILGVDNAHRLVRPWLGGQLGLDRLASLDAKLDRRVTWVLAMDRRAWPYIQASRAERALFHQVITLPNWSEEELAALVDARAKAVGIEPDYRDLVLPRQLDAGEHESVNERNRFGHARILWELSDGNPEVALRLFAQCLRVRRDGRVVPRLPQPIVSNALGDANDETLLVLRVVVQCDIASLDDIVKSLRISEPRAMASVRFCLQNHWLAEVEGGWRIEWRYYRTITRALARQNFIPR